MKIFFSRFYSRKRLGHEDYFASTSLLRDLLLGGLTLAVVASTSLPRSVRASTAPPEWVWAQSIAGDWIDYGTAAATDSQGNIYLTGSHHVIGSHTYHDFSYVTMFLRKYDAARNIIWTKELGHADGDYFFKGQRVGADAAGNVYLLAEFRGTWEIAGSYFQNYSSGATILVKFDRDGNALWALQGPEWCYACNEQRPADMKVDTAGNVYLAGSFHWGMQLGDVMIWSSGWYDADAFVAKIDSTGWVSWARQIGGTNEQTGDAVAVDLDGNVCLAGASSGPITYQGQRLPEIQEAGLYVLKLTSEGDLLWVKPAPSRASSVQSCAMDVAGNTYVVGNFGEVSFGSHVLHREGLPNVFVAKYDALGNVAWAQPLADLTDFQDTEVMAGGVALDIAGNIYVAGTFGGEALFGPTNLTSVTGLDDVFVAMVDPAGQVSWARQAGGDSFDSGHALAVDAAGNVWVTGEFVQQAAFGTNILTSSSADDTDGFMAELGSGIAGPVFLSQPQSVTTNIGITTFLTAAPLGAPPMTVQWWKGDLPLLDGGSIGGANSPRLVLRNIQSTDAGNYRLVASNAYGMATSTVAILTVNAGAIAPSLLVQPFGWSALRGDDVKFFVVAAGSEPLLYQWQYNGAPLLNATNATLTLSNVQTHQGGSYSVGVSNAAGAVTSSVAALSVEWTVSLGEAVDAPDLSWRTGDAEWVGQWSLTHDGSDAAQSYHTYDCDASWIETTVTGPGVISFWWKVSGNPWEDPLSFSINGTPVAEILGEIDWQPRSFCVPGGPQRLRWTYYGCHGDGLGVGWLDQVQFTAGPPPLPISSVHPENQTVPAGGGVFFTVETIGPEPMVYQWQLNGVDIPNATSPMLVLTNIQPNQAGSYTVRVSNLAGTLLSTPGTLTVSTAGCATAPQGLVNWWPGEDSASDIVGGANGVSYIGYGPGLVGSAFSFGGLESVRASGSNMRVGTNDFSVEGWAWAGSNDSWNALFSFGSSGPTLYIVDSGRLQFWPALPSQLGGFYDAQWHHFAMVRQNGVLTYFIDGDRAGSVPFSMAIEPEEIFVGGDGTPDSYYYGFIDEVSCYRRALPVTEVYQIYAARSVGKCRNPQAPVIHVQPLDQWVWPGGDAQFQVVVTGNPAPRLQWRCYGQVLTGETNATLTIRDVQLWHNNEYYVIAENALGTVISDPALLYLKWSDNLADALDATNLTWTTTGPAQWFAQTETTQDAEAAAQSGRIADSEQGSLETTLTEPGLLQFWWKVSSEENFDFLQFSINDLEQAAISGETAWEEVSIEIPSGGQTVRWTYSKDLSVSAGQDCGWLDQVRYTPASAPVISSQPAGQTVAPCTPVTLIVTVVAYPLPSYQWFFNSQPTYGMTNSAFKVSCATDIEAGEYYVVVSNALGAVTSDVVRLVIRSDISLGEAVDAPELEWRTSFYYPEWPQSWTPVSGVTHDGVDAVRSASIMEDNQSWLETTVTGPGLVSFWWKVSSLWYYDRLIFSIGGQAMTNISGEVDWNEQTFAVPPGPQVLRWTYAVADNGSRGWNCGWLDEVYFASNAVPIAPTILTQPQSQTVAQRDDVLFAVGAQGTRPFAYQWLFNGVNIPTATNDFLTLTKVVAARAGEYTVRISNSSGTAQSETARLQVGQPSVQWEWTLAAESEIWCDPRGVATDPAGNVFLVGDYNAPIRFGSITITNESERWDSFLVKFNSSGQALWEQHSSGPSHGSPFYSYPLQVAGDGNGNVVVAGVFRPDITLGDQTLTGGGLHLVKYDGLGQQLWVTQAASDGAEDFASIALDPAGNVFLGGQYQGEVTIGPYTLVNTNWSAAFLAKFSPEGEALWAVNIEGTWGAGVTSLAADSEGNVYLAGSGSESVVLGTNTFQMGPFIAKYHADGQLHWAQQWERDGSSLYKVAVDGGDNLFVTGCFSETVRIGTNVLVGTHASTAFLAKLDSSGQILWVKQGGGNRWTFSSDLAVDAEGNCYLSGDFSGVVTFDSHALVAEDTFSFFLVKYSPYGRVLWATKGAAESSGIGHFLTVDLPGHVYLAGGFNTAAYLGPYTLQPVSTPNLYLAKVSDFESVRFETSPPAFGVTNGVFHMQVSRMGGYGSVILEASTNMVQWQPVFTNSSAATQFEFSELLQLNQAARFYRARLTE